MPVRGEEATKSCFDSDRNRGGGGKNRKRKKTGMEWKMLGNSGMASCRNNACKRNL